MIKEHAGRHGCQQQAQGLGHPNGLAQECPVEQIQAVGPQALDPGPAQAVPEEVEPGVLPVEPASLGDDEEDQQQPDQVPKALVEERGMDLHVLGGADPHPHPPGQVRQAAEGLPVDEVGPAADDLAQEQADDGQVRHGAEGDLFQPGEDEGRQRPGDHGAVDGDAAVPDGGDPAPVQGAGGVPVEVQVEDDVVDPGAQDAAGHRPEHEVQHMVLGEAVALGLLHAKQHPRQKAQGQDDAVPVDAVADVEGDGVRVEFPVPEEAREADGHVLQGGQFRSGHIRPPWGRSR